MRYWATWAMAALGGEGALDLVAAQLEDSDAGVRMIAAKALALTSHPRAAVHLMRVLDDASDNVAYWASTALAALEARVLPRLIGLLGAPGWRTRAAAARTIVRMGPSVALKPVAAALKRPNGDVQYWALLILGELRDQRAAPLVVPFLQSTVRDLVTRGALTLGQLGWRPAIPRLVGLLGHADESVRLAAIEALAGFGDYSVRILTDLLASDRRVMKVSAAVSLSMVGDTALRGILEKLRDESSDLRFWAIRALERFDNPAIVPVLQDLLDDDEFDIQLAAATALRNYRMDEGTARSLVERLAGPSWRVRRALAESLGAQRHLPARVFADGLTSANEDVRYWTAWVVGSLGDPAAVELLMERFADPAWPVRRRAAESISRIGAPAAGRLSAILASPEGDGNARYWASRALVGVRDRDVLPTLVGLLDDPDWSIRRNAEEALLAFGHDAQGALLTALRTQTSRVVRENVSRCLVRLDGLDCDAVVSLFQFRDPDLNYWTSFVLGSRGRQALPCLDRMLTEGEERVRHLALRTMGAVDDPLVHERCIELLEDEYLSLRRIAAEILGRFRVREAVAPILKAAVGAAEDFRIVALGALGAIGDPSALPFLEEALADERWDVRKEAVTALGRLGTPEAAALLIELLPSERGRDLRTFLAEALGLLGDRRAAPVLARLLDEADEELALTVLTALGRLGDPGAFTSVAPFLASSSWMLRRAALDAVGAMGSIPDLAPLKDAVQSDDTALRSAAQRALRSLLGQERWQDYVDLTVRRALLEPAEEHVRRALELRAAGDLDAAADEVRCAIRCRRRGRYYTLLGTIHLERQRLDLARRNLVRALELEPDHPEALGKLATLAVMEGRRSEAGDLFERLLARPDLAPGLREVAERTLRRLRNP